MHTRHLMLLSATWMALIGLVATFLPQELLAYCGAAPLRLTVVLVQTLGAVYLGFAMLNWMARENLIGGIYSRPVALGNMVHFVIAALSLLRVAPTRVPHPGTILVVSIVYAAFAFWFGLVVYTNPVREQE